MSFDANKLFLFLRQYKYTICVSILFFIFSFLLRESIKGFNLKSFLHAFLNATILLSIWIIFAKTFLRQVVILLIALFAAFDIGLFFIYRNPLNYGIFASVMETNLSEIYNMGQLVLPVGLLFLALFYFILLKSSREIKISEIQFKIRYLLLYLLLVLFIYPFFSGKRVQQVPLDEYVDFLISDPLLLYANVNSDKYPFIIGDVFIISSYFKEQNDMKKIIAQVKANKDLPDGIFYDLKSKVADKIILMVGESSNFGNYSLYGYERKTTPFLDSLSTNKELLSYYRNVISPANYTRDALRICFSFSTPREFDPFIKEKNLINLASDAQYTTSWISNQNILGSYNTYINMLAASADTSIFNTWIRIDDLDLLPVFSDMIVPNKEQFIVIHMDGSHMNYTHKYDEEDTIALGNTGEYIEYDKTIHHSDRVFREIYKQVKELDENVLIYYFSDHGEVIGKGHGILDRYKIQYQVPLIVMQNRPFVNVDEIVNKYYDENGFLSTSSNIYILGELMGYQFSEEIIEKSKEEGKYVFQVNKTYTLYTNIKD